MKQKKSGQQKDIEKATTLLAELFIMQLDDKYRKKNKDRKKVKKNIYF